MHRCPNQHADMRSRHLGLVISTWPGQQGGPSEGQEGVLTEQRKLPQEAQQLPHTLAALQAHGLIRIISALQA